MTQFNSQNGAQAMTQPTLNIPNLDRLISYLEALHPENFSMSCVDPHRHTCGSACCILGHAGAFGWNHERIFAEALGVEYDTVKTIVEPDGWFQLSAEGENDDAAVDARFPLSRALRMLRHLRAEFVRTGTVVVDWDAPEAVETPRKVWTPPVVIGADKPLPAELTRLVREPATPAEV